MIISNKQIMQLMSICRRYAKVSHELGEPNDHEECKNLHREIEKQQSTELRSVE